MRRRVDAARAVALSLGTLGLAALAAHVIIELAINPRPPGVGDTGPAQALEAAVRAVADGLAVTGAAVQTEESHVVGELGDDPRKIPLVWHGEPAGTLLLGPPGARRFPRAYKRRMLAVLVPIVAESGWNGRSGCWRWRCRSPSGGAWRGCHPWWRSRRTGSCRRR
ncbi:hypothetical protein OG884_34585 [Streptosporangium sp. NBC_01755]|uniref:hypothetical protein n=1 Tax=unclassified Streptosporangium TaxID=2632669 RepID=UPI002DD8AA2E|nr:MULTISPECIES: hypothetical protein [unclassified Streptosporangium]WSA28683.1 hypothetical protein OIE13_12880 [Streptosporangium sp. NBC_01810]WSC99864.1 hypothetical protein OG884_34585 [Streptosporangium sp. NBC_01755]